MSFCSKCGEKLNDGARFCHACGAGIESAVNQNEQRRQEYVGKIYKCPNCGTVISKLEGICSGCGMSISGKTANDTVKQFKDELIKLEQNRKDSKSIIQQLFAFKCDPIDLQKLSLIKNYPVPNSIDEIIDFFMLAIANIDVGLSKRTMYNKLISAQEVNPQTISKAISDAWVNKMQQMYTTAELMYSKDELFVKVKKIYVDKMKELKIKV